ncbi:MAG: DUF2254 domain-containing protein [Bradyrhizobium sp.]|uniref:DUF2254 domain-containing protein n=1 Tax=Bradyrhizobium sp. TaxID=376 RepID=UPI002A2BF3A9|nr:DUF2254 domain-containing protein [Bradyrhizobium sp.]
MPARIRKFLADLEEAFWLIPALLSAAGAIAALALVKLDRASVAPQWLLEDWLYDGGAVGARTLLGAIAASTIGVAGTAFSITIAALSVAAGQMGPRLLRNFTRDRGNQVTLGTLVGTFCYALVALRSVRTESEGGFVPHLTLAVGIGLAFVCVAMLVYFVDHMARRINVDTVIDLVSADLHEAIERLTSDEPQPEPPAENFWSNAVPISDQRQGYLREIDEHGLAAWASEQKAAVRLLVRPGDYIIPGAPMALVMPETKEAETAVHNATALGSNRASSSDLRFAVRQLVDVAVRALSPGVNDPHTAIGVLNCLGAALCKIVPRHLRTGVHLDENGQPVLVVPFVQYDKLLDSMFHMIRQSAAGQPAVLIRHLEILALVASVEHDRRRLAGLGRHAALILEDANRTIGSPSDMKDVQERYDRFIEIAAQNGEPARTAGPNADVRADRLAS